jgi:hypothetical protein
MRSQPRDAVKRQAKEWSIPGSSGGRGESFTEWAGITSQYIEGAAVGVRRAAGDKRRTVHGKGGSRAQKRGCGLKIKAV